MGHLPGTAEGRRFHFCNAGGGGETAHTGDGARKWGELTEAWRAHAGGQGEVSPLPVPGLFANGSFCREERRWNLGVHGNDSRGL